MLLTSLTSDAGNVRDHATSRKHMAAAEKLKQRTGFEKSKACRSGCAAAQSQVRGATNKFLHIAFSLALLVVLENMPISKWAVMLG